jgi:hypothetical protein
MRLEMVVGVVQNAAAIFGADGWKMRTAMLSWPASRR